MQRLIWLGCAMLAVLAAWLWAFGGAEQLAQTAATAQREAQNAMAAPLRALRAGQPGAIAALLALCFAYGFFHAAGPGHGKLVIGGYGVARRVPVLRLGLLALAASVAQAATAICLVYGALWFLEWGRAQMVGLAEDVMAPLSYGLIALVGGWLAVRGASRLRAGGGQHGVVSAGGEACAQCGHKHAPTADEAASVRSVRDALVLICTIAVRPCTGALFLLIVTWQMDLPWAGVAGALVMGLGTACVTIGVALAAALLREGALLRREGIAAARMTAVLELGAGLLIAAVALQIALRLI